MVGVGFVKVTAVGLREVLLTWDDPVFGCPPFGAVGVALAVVVPLELFVLLDGCWSTSRGQILE